jgi:hypothetical protein
MTDAVAWDEVRAALAAGASRSHRAQGGGIWPDGSWHARRSTVPRFHGDGQHQAHRTARDRRHQPGVPQGTNGLLYRPWWECHDRADQSQTGPLRHDGRLEGISMDGITPAIGILGIIVGLPVAFIALHWWLHPERRLSWRRAREASGDAARGQARSSLLWWPTLGGGGDGGDGGDGGGGGDGGS